MTPQYQAAAFLVLLMAVAAWYALGRRRKAPSPSPAAGTVRALSELLEELRRTSQSMAHSLDRRAEELKELVAEADRRLEVLKAVASLQASSSSAVLQSVQSDPGSGMSGEVRGLYDTVCREADAGKSLTDIARDSGLNKGAVQLLLGLRETRRAARRPGASI